MSIEKLIENVLTESNTELIFSDPDDNEELEQRKDAVAYAINQELNIKDSHFSDNKSIVRKICSQYSKELTKEFTGTKHKNGKTIKTVIVDAWLIDNEEDVEVEITYTS